MAVGDSRGLWPALLLAVAGGLSACAGPSEPEVVQGQAMLEGRTGSSMTGLATFKEDETGVWIELDLYGAPPGEHGVHIFEGDSCEGFSAELMGVHFNPYRRPHGLDGEYRHAGDVGNIKVDEAGLGRLQAHLPGLRLGSGFGSIAGRTVAVSERRDDGSSQPDGATGRPIGCGVIYTRRTR